MSLAVCAKVDLVLPMSKRMRRLLALDQASHTTGWSVFLDNKLEAWGHFDVDDEVIGERLHKIREKVAQLIADYDINELAFEDIQLQNNVVNNVQTFKTLAEVFGVIWELAVMLGIPHTAVLAGTWKSTLGIAGKNRLEQKRNAQAFAQNRYGIKCTQDEADSLCIGTHMLIKHGLAEKPATKTSVADEGFNWG